MFDGHFLFTTVTMDGATVMTKGFRLVMVRDFFDGDAFTTHANHGITIAFFEVFDLLLGCGLLIDFRFDKTLAGRLSAG